MHLMRLIYASKISGSFEMSDIDEILKACHKNNPKIHVTGVLCYSNDYFIQCLEGSRINVNQLYHKILADKRHYDPAILQYQEIAKRDFSEWTMGFIPPPMISGAMVSEFSGVDNFQPYSMSGESCYLLLKALSEGGLLNQ